MFKLPRLLPALLLALCLPAHANWHLDGESSRLSFITSKNGNVSEVHRFLVLHGKVDRKGAAELQIDHAVGGLLPDDKLQRLKALQAQGHKVLMLGDGDPHAIGAEIPTDPLQHLLLLTDGDGGVDYHALEGASFLGTGDHANILCYAEAISMARRNNCAGLPPRTLIQCGSFLKRGAVYR